MCIKYTKQNETNPLRLYLFPSKIKKSPSLVTSPPIARIASGSNGFAGGLLFFLRFSASDSLCAFYHDHQQGSDARTLSSYVSLALFLNPPPALTLKVKEAAEQNGRYFYIDYDISGANEYTFVNDLKKDLEERLDVFR